MTDENGMPEWERNILASGHVTPPGALQVPGEDDGLTCNCHDRLPKKGWTGKLPVAADGSNWPLDFAAKMLGCPEKDLRDLVRILEVEPAGTMKMSSYRRSGRHPRVYDGSVLVRAWQGIRDLAENLHGE